jgi:hypothetical protein
MPKSRLPHLLWLFVLASLLAGCGGFSNPPTPTPLPTSTQPPPTVTPVPPTNTPVPTDTPAPTVTPVPTQSIDDIVNLLKPVVEGTGVPEAAAYDPDKPGIHPLVFISPVDQGVWDVSLPKTWIPLNVSQVELVAVLRYTDVLLQLHWFGTSKGGKTQIGRYRIDTEVWLREARTGTQIAFATFRGDDPLPFPSHLPSGVMPKGEATSSDVIQIWLKSYVEK